VRPAGDSGCGERDWTFDHHLMLRRQFFNLCLLALTGLVFASSSLAATQSLVPSRTSGRLTFNARRVSLGSITTATLKVGTRRIALRITPLRFDHGVRRIIIEHVDPRGARRRAARLILRGERSRARRARSARRVVKIVSVAYWRSQHKHAKTSTPTTTAGTQRTTSTAQPPVSKSRVATSPPTAAAPTPASTTPAPNPTSTVAVGVNVGSAIQWELQFAQTLGAKNVRMNFNIDTPTSQMDPIIAAYAAAGIRPELLATFDAGTIPTASEVANLQSWATRYGPGGTFWAQSGYPASLAVTRIEFGNESSGNWEYPALANLPSWWNSSGYEQVAEQYGQAYVQAVSDVSAANPGVKTLAVADSPGNVPEWLQYMFQGAPTLKNVVQGWVVHPYGAAWQSDINTTLAQTQALGASSSVPVYVTEVGVATDNGNCLNGNYGWNACMSYAQAATTITSQVQAIETDLGSRLAELDLYSARDLNTPGTTNDMESYFGALGPTGQSKGPYTNAVENILASTPS
jgi:hypothetical protein